MNKEIKDRIEMITKNLQENENSYRDGKRSTEYYHTCKADGESRLSELRTELRNERTE